MVQSSTKDKISDINESNSVSSISVPVQIKNKFLAVELTSVSKSEEESVEEVGEPVSKVLNDTDPKLSPWFLAKPALKFRGCKPRGHPSSYN